MEHSADARLRGCAFAGGAGPRGGVQHAAFEAEPAKATLGIANRFTFGMRGRVLSLHDAAWTFAGQRAVQHQHRTVGLITQLMASCRIAAAASYQRASGARTAA